jgi:hypothetical protein
VTHHNDGELNGFPTVRLLESAHQGEMYDVVALKLSQKAK